MAVDDSEAAARDQANHEKFEFKADEWLSRTHGNGETCVTLKHPISVNVLPYRTMGGRVVVEGADTFLRFRNGPRCH